MPRKKKLRRSKEDSALINRLFEKVDSLTKDLAEQKRSQLSNLEKANDSIASMLEQKKISDFYEEKLNELVDMCRESFLDLACIKSKSLRELFLFVYPGSKELSDKRKEESCRE